MQFKLTLLDSASRFLAGFSGSVLRVRLLDISNLSPISIKNLNSTLGGSKLVCVLRENSNFSLTVYFKFFGAVKFSNG